MREVSQPSWTNFHVDAHGYGRAHDHARGRVRGHARGRVLDENGYDL